MDGEQNGGTQAQQGAEQQKNKAAQQQADQQEVQGKHTSLKFGIQALYTKSPSLHIRR